MEQLDSGLRASPCRGSVRLCRAQAVRREAPRIGGSFAVWGGLFSTFDCTLVAVRRKVRRLGRPIGPAAILSYRRRSLRTRPHKPGRFSSQLSELLWLLALSVTPHACPHVLRSAVLLSPVVAAECKERLSPVVAAECKERL